MYSFKLTFLLALILPLWLLADGLIIIDPPLPGPPRPGPIRISPYPLAVTHHRVKVTIREHIATTEVEQVFRNPTARQLQGYYIFPLPPGAALDRFTLEIDGKAVPGELLDAQKAREFYEDQVRKWIDPALLEYQGSGLIKIRIFPFAPGQERRITLRYREILQDEFGVYEYRYPLSTEKFSSEPLKTLQIAVEVNSQKTIHNLFSPTHAVEIARENPHRWQAAYEAEQVKPERNFRLFFSLGADEFTPTFLTYSDNSEAGFFMLTLPGNLSPAAAGQPKDIVFLLDASGSMKGEKLDKAKQALRYCIGRLKQQDRFEIIRFSTRAEQLFGEYVFADEEHRRQAEKFIGSIEAIGGTNYQAALEMMQGLQSKRGKTKRPGYAIFITDGKPTVAETRPEQLLNLLSPGNIRIFTLGIGYEVNTHLLDRISEQSGGTRSYITPDEDLEQRISNFYRQVSEPLLSKIRIRTDSAVRLSDMYPASLPDLFRGTGLNILGRFRGAGKSTLIIEGNRNGQQRQFRFPIEIPSTALAYDFIPPLWATRAVGYLLDQIRLHGETEELKSEIIQLAKRFGVMTPYTSYLVLEDEQRISRDQPNRPFRILPEEFREDAQLQNRGRLEYDQFAEQSGAGSVRRSKEMLSLQGAKSISDVGDLKKRMFVSGKNGATPSIEDLIKIVNGRAFYRHGRVWVDSRLEDKTDLPVEKILFGSREYFELLQKQPELKNILALGARVRFVAAGRIIEIKLDGQ